MLVLSVGLPLPDPPVLPEAVIDGGGGTILVPRFVPGEVPREVGEPPLTATLGADGGGGTILAVRVPPEPPPRFVEETAGGGGTTSCVPKSLPIMLLTMDELFAWDGGGGTTAGEEPRVPPLSSLRRSRGESSEGGGATTAGAGRLSLAVRALSRSGEETGGGTTAVLFICTREGETSRFTDAEAGGMMLVRSAGVERD